MRKAGKVGTTQWSRVEGGVGGGGGVEARRTMGRGGRDQACQVDRSICRRALMLMQSFPWICAAMPGRKV